MDTLPCQVCGGRCVPDRAWPPGAVDPRGAADLLPALAPDTHAVSMPLAFMTVLDRTVLRGKFRGTLTLGDASEIRALAAPRDRLVAGPTLEVLTVTMSSAGHPVRPGGSGPLVDELFQDTEPVRSAEDLARAGVFAEGEVEEFLADLYAMRRSDVG